jgi:hypothetical protein
MIDQVAARRLAEDAIARELTARGAVGVPMYSIYADEDATDEPAVRAALEREGYTGLVVFRPVGEKREYVAAPPYVGPEYSMYWGGYHGYGWAMPWYGPEIVSYRVVYVETLVYSLRQNRLVWGGQSTAMNPSGVDRLVHETAANVANELQRQGLLPEDD